MRSRAIVGSVAFVASLAVGYAVSASAATPVVKWALVNEEAHGVPLKGQ
jgi:hypothetical protein